MQTLILPGYSETNKEWAYLASEKLKAGDQIRPIYWEHWTDPEHRFDASEKALLISRHTRGEPINIIAKSIGSLVAALIIAQIPDQVNKVVVCGIPLSDISDEDKETIRKSLAGLKPENLVVFQNENDPHGNYAEAREFLPKSIKVVSKPRDDHDYPFFEEFNSFLS